MTATAIALTLLACCLPAAAAEPVPMVPLTFGDRPVMVLDNSDTFSQINQISSSGNLVGVREVAEENNTIFRYESFVCVDGQSPQLAMVEGFTAQQVEAVADDGTTVGYQSRPLGSGPGSLIAVVWDGRSGAVARLPLPEGSTSGHAQDISADGKRITGYVAGGTPSHLRPALWTRTHDTDDGRITDSWTVQKLPTQHEANPYTMSSAVRISPNGVLIATCCTDKLVQGLYDNSLYMWRQDALGHWHQTRVCDEAMYVNDINDQGEIVGTMTVDETRRGMFVSATGEVTMIPLLDGDVHSSANGISADGIVVGNSDDEYGPDGGPQAFLWNSRQPDVAPVPLPMGDGPFSTATAINGRGQIVGTALVTLPTGGDATPSERSLGFVTVAAENP